MPLNRLNNSLFWRFARNVVARVERSETRGRFLNSHTFPGFASLQLDTGAPHFVNRCT
jgi:hypothetical protein